MIQVIVMTDFISPVERDRIRAGHQAFVDRGAILVVTSPPNDPDLLTNRVLARKHGIDHGRMAAIDDVLEDDPVPVRPTRAYLGKDALDCSRRGWRCIAKDQGVLQLDVEVLDFILGKEAGIHAGAGSPEDFHRLGSQTSDRIYRPEVLVAFA